MILFDNEVKLNSDLYGTVCLIDSGNIHNYPQLDRTWVNNKQIILDLKPLLGTKSYTDYSALWCAKLDGLKKKDLMFVSAFISFPNHVEPNYRGGTYYLHNRINPLYESTLESFAILRAARLIQWRLMNRPQTYFYNYIYEGNVGSCTQENRDFFNSVLHMNNYQTIKTIENFDATGNSVAFATFNEQNLYDIALDNGLIDQTLDTEVKAYLSSVNK